MIKSDKYFKLFFSTFYLSAVTFGGGYVIVPLLKKKFVDDLQWIDEDEMLNLTAIAQASPGPVAVNVSLLMGYQIAGIAGALIAISGTVLPPLITISIISIFYSVFRNNAVVGGVLKGMQAGVAAVICDVVINMGGRIVKDKDILSIVVMIGTFVLAHCFKVNIIFIILGCGILGVMRSFLSKQRKERFKS